MADASHTFLWHDYETFGANPRRDRPSQFAAVRTDAELNEVGEPIMLYCQPAPDFLPSPTACLLTGITPQHCLAEGVPEHEFAARIEAAFSQPRTIGVGYNTIRFDDEVTRFMFWRNLIDPYAREWQNECGRWDLLDVVRLTYALRPEGIEWPKHPDGKPSFKLEDLTRANGLAHESAHDALSDVRATIAMARLIRQKQPRLFDFALALRRKERVAQELGLPASPQTARPFVHVSGMFGTERGCLALMWPLASHPTNRNELLAWDLSHDPSELADLDLETMRLRLFTRSADLPEGVARLPIKSIHLNKSPMVVGNPKMVEMAAGRWGIDLAQAERHAVTAAGLPDLSERWRELFDRPRGPALDVDEDLYGGFVGPADRRRLNQLRALSPQELALARSGFDDARLAELVLRYRARNFPATLSLEEAAHWEALRTARLVEGEDGWLNVDHYFAEIDTLAENADERVEALLGALYDYAEAVIPAG
ncbi:exodeoxyribonuclease I [Pseudacidovorax sp. RU35E]|uniref:exodeoxyribonuclease I n=1 Tax=Pseudacidovorax sp. RU35E TaxID=1907403 RepID=UPI0009547F95|nr:exodeoxyribonuclease I [Pseudacidovorax sp. RU35E]SIP89303.1 Exodeoxyribonuclease I subunit C [Pseudacidovorax sp. RU35E]